MKSINVEVKLFELTQSKKLRALIAEKVGEPLTMYVATFASSLSLGLQMAQVCGEEAREELGEAMTANFLAALIAMQAPEGIDEALQAFLSCSTKVNFHLHNWIQGMEQAGAEVADIPVAQSQLHAYMEKHLDLSEEIQLMENL